MLSCVEYEKCFITSGPDSSEPRLYQNLMNWPIFCHAYTVHLLFTHGNYWNNTIRQAREINNLRRAEHIDPYK